jgi:hypothetical protein
LAKLPAATEAQIIGTILAASMIVSNRCTAVVAVSKKTIKGTVKTNKYRAYD